MLGRRLKAKEPEDDKEPKSSDEESRLNSPEEYKELKSSDEDPALKSPKDNKSLSARKKTKG